MTREQECLLLTVARVLRASLREDVNAFLYPDRHDDIKALDEALAPFQPSGTAINLSGLSMQEANGDFPW